MSRSPRRVLAPEMRLTQQQLEAHLMGAANILRGRTAGQDYKNYILSLIFYKRLSDQWDHEADEAIKELERQQGREFTEAERTIFRKRGEHRFTIPDGSRWGDVKAASTNIGEVLTRVWPPSDYSDSPAASMASAGSAYICMRISLPPSMVNT
jgi:type I restriction-modification system DNA methylase subunit